MIRGFITNLRAYNEGRLQGKWIDFPIMEDEMEDVLEEIGINEDYEEYFFTDWETDREVDCYKEFGECPNINEVNEISDELESIDRYHQLDWLLAYIECTEANLSEAIRDYEDRSVFYWSMDSDEITENYLIDSGMSDTIYALISRHIDADDFVESELCLYNSSYGYIDCF